MRREIPRNTSVLELVCRIASAHPKTGIQGIRVVLTGSLSSEPELQRVNKAAGVWSARITDDYRVLGYRKNGEMRWFWIGSHAEYDKLI